MLLLDESSQGVVRELAAIIRARRNMKLAVAAGGELPVTVKGRMVHAATPERFRAEERGDLTV